MSLTMGTGPFGHAPAGSFNFDTPENGAILLDLIPHRVRGLKVGETVVDSNRVNMLHESRILPHGQSRRTPILSPTEARGEASQGGWAVCMRRS
jgi:hypothetical protein